MKNKGFTLVELLAVIVILGLLATIAVPSAINISNSIKKNLYCEKVDMILTDAKRWGDDHLSKLRSDCYTSITVADLVEEGITKKEDSKDGYIINPVTNNKMDDSEIGVYKKNKRAYAFYMEKESDEQLQNACEALIVTDRPTTKCK